MKRRSFLIAAGALIASRPAYATGKRVVAIDWGLAETVLALSAPLAGLAESAGYREWVAEPRLPATTADLGLRSTPNLDYVAALRPDFILSTPQFAAIHPVLEQIAPVLDLATFTDDLTPFANAVSITRELGRRLGREDAAEQLIADTNAKIARLRAASSKGRLREVLVVNFHDDTHHWVFGAGSLFHDVLTQAGLVNAWKGEGNAWGIANATVDQLAPFDHASLFIVEPVPPSVGVKLRERTGDDLISRLAIFDKGHFRILPPNWAFGALHSAGRFADALTAEADFLTTADGS